VLYSVAVGGVAVWLLVRQHVVTRRDLLVLCLGFGVAQGSFSVLFGLLIGNLLWAAAGAAFVAAFVAVLLGRVRRAGGVVFSGVDAGQA
jgi:uncharacterized membrane protein YjjB (DUF3815 family)